MRKWFVRSLIAFAGAVFMAAPVTAAPATGSPGQGLEISPPVIELTADPGQTVTATIRVRNVTQGILIAKGKADDFGASNDEGGQPKLLLDETGATRYSLKYWVPNVPDMQLAPGELKTTKISITVPANAEPGGHFGVIRFTAVPPDLQGTGVALSASVGSLVLLKVSGPVTEKLSLAEFATTKGATKTSFFESGPVDFLVRIKNEGSVHEKAQGSITVTGGLGQKLNPVPVNDKGGNVLPDSIRRFEQTLKNRQLFGHYTAKLTLTYGGKQKLEQSIGFWVVPWKLLLLVLIGLVIVVLLGRIGLQRYNEYIIAQARRGRR